MSVRTRDDWGTTLRVRGEQVGAAIVIALDGRLTVESSEQALIRELIACVRRSRPHTIVLDLEHVRQLDCSGIGMLLRLRRDLARWGRTLVLIKVGRLHRQLLERVGLSAALPVFDTREEALRAGEGTAPNLPRLPIHGLPFTRRLREFQLTQAQAPGHVSR